MAIHHLTLPNFNEPPPRIPIAARYSGPVLAAMRRHAGYQFMDPPARAAAGNPHLRRAIANTSAYSPSRNA